MAVSLGMRISGLLVVGAVAVAAAAFTGDGRGTADGRGGGGTVVTAGPTADAARPPTGPAGNSSAPPKQRPDGHIGTPVITGTPVAPPVGRAPSDPPSPSPSPSVSRKALEVPGWLPPGPASPDADGVPDPASVYDLLSDPSGCRAALGVIPRLTTDGDRALLRGLASACLAVQGEGGDWAQAVRDHAASAGGGDSCKGRAAHSVLGGLLDFRRRHPGASVRLKPASGGPPACDYRIAGVDTGGDGTAAPGETIGIELADPYFDPAELPSEGGVSIGGQEAPVRTDRAVLSVVVPALAPGPVEVTVRYGGTEARLPMAFTVALPEPNAPDEATGGPATPQGARGTARPATTNPRPQAAPSLRAPVTAATAGAPARPTPG
ncbi:hypothetical protein ACWEOP_32990 [Streptomyces chartreusis]